MEQAKRPDTVQVYEQQDGDFAWRRKAANGEIVARSEEGYRDRTYAAQVAKERNPGLEVRILFDNDEE